MWQGGPPCRVFPGVADTFPLTHHKPIIGVAGGIGSGKSTVARQMARMGGVVIEADAAAREALQRAEVRDRLVEWWGPQLLDEQGRVDRRRVADCVFGDPARRERLERLLHPIVAEQREQQIAEAEADPGVAFIVLDAPLLFEVGLDKRCDEVVFVDADRSRRLERVARQRGWSAEELDRREKNQMSLDRKRQLADNVIVNDVSEAACFEQVRQVLTRILGHNPSNA